jgi:hypothetical protein
MGDKIFEWDENKNISNTKKHGVSFQEARTIFKDENLMCLTVESHSHDKERILVIGESTNTRLLVVCHCYRESETVIRLISARKANKIEAKWYMGGI